MRVSGGAAGYARPTPSKAIEAHNPADGVACDRPHKNHDGGTRGRHRRYPPGHSWWPSDRRRGLEASQRCRGNSARSGSESSPPRCTPGCASGYPVHRPPIALGINRGSKFSERSRMRTPSSGPPRSTPGRPLRPTPWSPEGPTGLGCVAASSPSRCALRPPSRTLQRLLDQAGLGAIEARSPPDEVACERHHRDHHGQHLFVLFDLRRDHPKDLRGSDASPRRRRRRSPSVSMSSSSWCGLGSSPGTALRRTRGAYRSV